MISVSRSSRPDFASAPVQLPASLGQAVRCPRCGNAHLFARFLKPMPFCPACGQDWKHQRADDFPAYIAMLLTGHLLAPLIIGLELGFAPAVDMLAAIVVPSAMLTMLALLQPAKGAVIALQWWFGMHGFARERQPVLAVRQIDQG
jgi:uncharacterized protein (DUF983 family)